jgi:hypothetical protein
VKKPRFLAKKKKKRVFEQESLEIFMAVKVLIMATLRHKLEDMSKTSVFT